MNTAIEVKLKQMKDSGTTEGRTVAELLEEIKAQEEQDGTDSGEIRDIMVAVAKEIRDWAQSYIDQFGGVR